MPIQPEEIFKITKNNQELPAVCRDSRDLLGYDSYICQQKRNSRAIAQSLYQPAIQEGCRNRIKPTFPTKKPGEWAWATHLRAL